MKYVFLGAAMLLILTVTGQQTEQKITVILQTQAQAWNEGDIDGFMKYYWNSPELSFVGKNGVSKGWQKVYDNYKKNYPTREAMGILTFDQLVFDVLSAKACLVTGSWHLQKEKEAGGWFTLLFKKIKGEWLIVYDHTS